MLPNKPNINTLRPRQNGRYFADDTFKCIFKNENVRISINISLKFVPKGLINNILSLVQIMAWRRLADKPLSEPIMVNLLTHICVARPQWVNTDQGEPVIIYFYVLLLVVLQLCSPSCWHLYSNYCRKRCRHSRMRFVLSLQLPLLHLLSVRQSDISIFTPTWTAKYSPNPRMKIHTQFFTFPFGGRRDLSLILRLF